MTDTPRASLDSLTDIGRTLGEELARFAIGALNAGDVAKDEVDPLTSRMAETVRTTEVDMHEEGYTPVEIEAHNRACVAGFRTAFAAFRAGVSASLCVRKGMQS